MNIETMNKPIKVASMQFESDEILALMWAVEQATCTETGGDDITERAWAVHSRLQEAWKALLEASGKKC